jgi:hypothetical protein
VPDENTIRILAGTAVETGQLERDFDNDRRRVPVFEIEEYQSLTKQLGFMLRFNSQPSLYMVSANSFDKILQGCCDPEKLLIANSRSSLPLRLQPELDPPANGGVQSSVALVARRIDQAWQRRHPGVSYGWF